MPWQQYREVRRCLYPDVKIGEVWACNDPGAPLYLKGHPILEGQRPSFSNIQNFNDLVPKAGCPTQSGIWNYLDVIVVLVKWSP